MHKSKLGRRQVAAEHVSMNNRCDPDVSMNNRCDPDVATAPAAACLHSRYVPHAFEGGYVISGQFAVLIGSQHDTHIASTGGDGTSMGVWLAPYRLKRVHSPRQFATSLQKGKSTMKRGVGHACA